MTKDCGRCRRWLRRDASTGHCNLTGSITWCDATCDHWIGIAKEIKLEVKRG